MDRKDIFKIWAPFGKKWVDWVRPVPFIGIDINKSTNYFIDYDIPSINYIKEVKKDTAIIIDIDGVESIKEGIALANMGYRPIPVFNGTNPSEKSKSTTDNQIIENMLIWGAYELKNINLLLDAPPVFLLDKNRLNRYKLDRSIFDNSWDIYPQDIPSSKYFLNNGINKIIVRGEVFNKDLKKVLYKLQKDNIDIFFTNGYDEAKVFKIKKQKDNDF